MDARRRLVAAALILGVGVLLSTASCQGWQTIDVIPPKNSTETNLHVTYLRIQAFWNKHGRVPIEPAELPVWEDHVCSMKDGWGRELNWESDGKNHVKVWSLGRDGQPGGTGDDADMEIVFVGKQKPQDDFPTIQETKVRP